MVIKVLGSGCTKCKNLHQSVEQVVRELGTKNEVIYSTDVAEIIQLGAMSSPVLAIDNRVVFAGKIPSLEEIKQAIENAQK